MTSQQLTNIPADCRRNPWLPAVSLPLARGVTPALPDFGSKEGMTQQAIDDLLQNGNSAELQQSPIANHQIDFDKPSTSANLASSNAAGGNNRLKPSLYTLPAVKIGNFETTTAYNQKLGALALWVGRLFPASEASA
jgi:hypothetical protein